MPGFNPIPSSIQISRMLRRQPPIGGIAFKSGVTQHPFPLKRADGGGIPDSPLSPVIGAINTTTPGRADAHPTHVPPGSYVMPADIVSMMGEGNTAAGHAMLAKMFLPLKAQSGQQITLMGQHAPYGATGAPYGAQMPPAPHGGGLGIPSPPRPPVQYAGAGRKASLRNRARRSTSAAASSSFRRMRSSAGGAATSTWGTRSSIAGSTSASGRAHQNAEAAPGPSQMSKAFSHNERPPKSPTDLSPTSALRGEADEMQIFSLFSLMHAWRFRNILWIWPKVSAMIRLATQRTRGIMVGVIGEPHDLTRRRCSR